MTENNRNTADIHILQQKSSLKDIYPVTYTSAVYDDRTGANLTALLHQFNNVHLPYAGTSFDTRNQLPEEQRRKGVIISYVDIDGNTITEQCVADTLTNDEYWGLDENWRKLGDIILNGELSVSSKGTWVINGEETNIKAVGPKGDNGATPILKTVNNKLHYSYDGINWIETSENIAAWFRWNATTADTQSNNLGRLQISRDNGTTWTTLSGDITNNLHISKYIGADESLPTSGIAEGTIYAKGPYYEEGDTLHDNPIYRLWVYAWKGDTLAWQDNGEFTSIAAGVVQELGDSKTEVVSQLKATDTYISTNKYCFHLQYPDLIDYINKYNYSCTIKFNVRNLVFGNFKYGTFDNNYSYTDFIFDDESYTYNLDNGEALYANLNNFLISKRTGLISTNLLDSFLIIINVYGYLYSPFPNIQILLDKIQIGTNNLKLNGGEIGNKISECSKYNETQISTNPAYTSDIIFEKNIGTNDVYKIDKTETITGLYAETIDDSNSDVAIRHKVSVKKCFKIKFILKYTCDRSENLYAAIYFQGDSGWINNSGYVRKPLVASSSIQTLEIERNYEENVTSAFLFCGRGDGLTAFLPNTNIKIYSCETLLIGAVNNDLKESSNININTITIESDSTWNKLRNTINSISDNSENNRYVIYLKNGIYNEIDILTKDYVDIEGQSRDGVIIYTDGLSEELSPDTYVLNSQYANTIIKNIPKAWKHQWIHTNNSTVSNLTCIVNNCKYINHQDARTNSYTAIFENCRFVRREDLSTNLSSYDMGLQALIGVGAVGGQNQVYKNIVFEYQNKNIDSYFSMLGHKEFAAIFWHNWNNQSKNASLTLEDCVAINCSWGTISELGSGQGDIINIKNCICKDKFNNYFVYSVTPGYYIPSDSVSATEDVELIPYCISVNMASDIPIFLSETRYKGIDNIKHSYLINKEINENVTFGHLYNDDNYGIIVAQSDGIIGEIVSFLVANLSYAIAEAGSYSKNDLLYVSNNKLTKNKIGNPVGNVAKDTVLNEVGYINYIKYS